MKRSTVILAAFLSLCGINASGQLTLERCQEMARENYPLIARYGLIVRSEEYNLKNASKAYLPQPSLSASATYQTEVTTIPVTLPGIEIPGMKKDQYQVVAEVSQTIWDGGVTSSQKEAIAAQSSVDRAQFEMDMYAVRGRVNDIFFGILMLDRQLALNTLYEDDLRRSYEKVESYIANGVANSADLDAVGVERLLARQSRAELETLRIAYLRMLSAFVGMELDREIELATPPYDDIPMQGVNNRPELALFESSDMLLEARRRGIAAGNRPRLGLFVQGGYGRPGLNFLSSKFSFYALGGIRLSWNFGSLYTRRNDLRKIDLGHAEVNVNREVFLFNTSLQTDGKQAEVEKYRRMLADDDRIIEMRGNILRAAEAKTENGTMSVLDLVREFNAQQQARVNKAVHEIGFIRAVYEFRNLIND